MPEPLTLSREEIQEITGLQKFSAQARALKRMQVPFERRPADGSLIVGRDAMKKALGYPTQRDPSEPAANGLNWSKTA